MELAECDPELLCVPIEWRKLQEVLCTDFRLKIFQIESNTRELMLTRLKPFWYGMELDLLEESLFVIYWNGAWLEQLNPITTT